MDRALTWFVRIWVTLGVLANIIGIIGIFYGAGSFRDGWQKVGDVYDRFNIWNYLAELLTFAPAAAAYAWRERRRKRGMPMSAPMSPQEVEQIVHTYAAALAKPAVFPDLNLRSERVPVGDLRLARRWKAPPCRVDGRRKLLLHTHSYGDCRNRANRFTPTNKINKLSSISTRRLGFDTFLKSIGSPSGQKSKQTLAPDPLVFLLRAAGNPLHLMAAEALGNLGALAERLQERIAQLEAVARLNGETIRNMQRAAAEAGCAQYRISIRGDSHGRR